MQVFINISDNLYKDVKQLGIGNHYELIKAIRNGTPLPKRHGRLIDCDEIIDDIQIERTNLFMNGLKGTPRAYMHLNDLQDKLENAPTIIEAESEG